MHRRIVTCLCVPFYPTCHPTHTHTHTINARLADYVAVQASSLPKIAIAVACWHYTVHFDAAAKGYDWSYDGWVAAVVKRVRGTCCSDTRQPGTVAHCFVRAVLPPLPSRGLIGVCTLADNQQPLALHQLDLCRTCF